MLISKPSSAVVWAVFLGRFLRTDPCGLDVSYRDENWGLGGRNGVVWPKNKIFEFFHRIYVAMDFGRIFLCHDGFSENDSNRLGTLRLQN